MQQLKFMIDINHFQTEGDTFTTPLAWIYARLNNVWDKNGRKYVKKI